MTLGRIGEEVIEEFSVLDSSNDLVSGIPLNEFSAHLFNPSDVEVYDSTSVNFIELGHGHYRVSFIPNEIGNWMMIVYHSTLFPWGKSNTIQVFNEDLDTLGIDMDEIDVEIELMANKEDKILGLVQENFFVDQTVYDENNNLTNSRVRIYKNAAAVGTDNEIHETYIMTATYVDKLMTDYKMVKQ